uniref:DNA-3-methyladenine glycosylase II n=1 Tax=Terrapene triunguis TaxID=2587831 RepID=A0A674I6Z0_9SAUR
MDPSGAESGFSRMMPRKRKRLTPLNAVQSKPSFSPADTSGISSKYFSEEKRTSSRLGTDFFNQSCISLAKSFLGQVIDTRTHVHANRFTLWYSTHQQHKLLDHNRILLLSFNSKVMVYYIYSSYFSYCSTGEGAAVLLRSLEPLQGLDTMRQLRSTQRKGSANPLKDWQLCNGPSKLCQALAINKSFDQKDLARDTAVWMEPGSEAPGEQAVVTAARIGVSYGGEWAQKPLRFYIRGNKCVSVVDKKVEREQGAAD